jgi:hypothetical protein
MPNWCECELKIMGPPALLQQIKEDVTGYEIMDDGNPVARPNDGPKDMATEVVVKLLEKRVTRALDFDRIVPMPAELKDTTSPRDPDKALRKKYGADNWYDWSIYNWGTKWNASEPDIISQTTKTMTYGFATAWSPPIPVAAALSERYPTARVTLSYWECGMGYQGKMVFKAGEIIRNTEGKYHGRRGG